MLCQVSVLAEFKHKDCLLAVTLLECIIDELRLLSCRIERVILLKHSESEESILVSQLLFRYLNCRLQLAFRLQLDIITLDDFTESILTVLIRLIRLC